MPALHAARKSAYHPGMVDRAIREAGHMSYGTPETLPVFLGGRLVGFVGGAPHGAPGQYWGVTRDRVRDRMRCSSDSEMIKGMSRTQPGARTISFAKAFDGTHVADNWYDLWPVGGQPEAGPFGGAARTAKQISDTMAGAIYNGGNVAPMTKRLAAQEALNSVGLDKLLLVDRVLTYEACTFAAGLLAMTNGVAAQRYAGPGEGGLKLSLAAQTANSTTAANLTGLTYVDQDGVTQTGNTARTVAKIVSAAAPTNAIGARLIAPADTGGTVVWSPWVPLAAGGGGARSITNYTWSAAPTGTFTAVLQRPLAYVMGLPAAGAVTMQDEGQRFEGFPQLFDGAALSFLAFVTAAGVVFGFVTVGWT